MYFLALEVDDVVLAAENAKNTRFYLAQIASLETTRLQGATVG